MSALAKIYGKHVLSGKKSIDEVPETIREEVKEYVLSVDPNFFDVPEEPIEEPVEEPVEEPTEETPVDDNSETSAEVPTSSVSGGEENPTEGEDTPVDTSEETATEEQTEAE